MTSESKILTVSYGTFSCTLEGFDDPFNTMKSIAEYFRDLTADDRYFGAEPPQPDAAMLHRIAEREVSRLVDARVRENGVHLRPQDGAAPAPVTPMPAAEVAPAPAPVEPALHDAMPEGVAAKLARVRHSVTIDPVNVALPEDEALTATALDDLLDAPAPDALADQPAAAFRSDALSQLEALLRAPADEAADVPVDTDVLVDSAVAEDLLPEDLAPESTDDLVLADLDPGLDAASIDTAVFEAPQDDTPQTDITFADAAFEDLQPEDAADVPDSLTEALVDDPLPEALDPEALDVESVAADQTADVPLVAPVEATPEVAETDRPGGRGKRVNSRVVRLRPNDAEDARQDRPTSRRLAPNGDDAEISRLMRQTDDALADDENRRRLDSIAQLKAAVVATEADRALSGETKPPVDTRSDAYRDDLADVVQPDDVVPAAEKPAQDDPAVKPRRKTVSVRSSGPRPGTIRPGMMGPPPLVLVSEQRIDRFSAVPPATPAPVQTPNQTTVQAPAAEAVPQSAPIATPAAPTVQRDDLPMVGLRTGRLTGAIGLGAASPMAPQKKIVLDQPSQGAGGELDDEEEHDEDLSATEQAGLVEFAERVGVKSMAEMLEAAAAYATCIEKRSQFTRPQLMRRLMASAGTRQVSREDGLRSFGTLLRTGRIEKVSRGHYMLAETSPYLAEARRLS